MRVTTVIPAHNEAATIAGVVRSCMAHARVIVVDDGSSDITGDLAREAGAEVVRNHPGRGYDGALQSGFVRALELGFEAVITLDADGQHDPDLLPAFVEPLGSGRADLVLGVRPRPARFGEWLFCQWGRLSFNAPDLLCGMKGYRMQLFEEHGRFDGCRSVGTELAVWALRAGRSFALVPVPIRPRLDAPRFGNRLRANWRLLTALWRVAVARADQRK